MIDRCIIYARTNTPPLCGDCSVQDQVLRLMNYAKANKIKVESVIVGDGEFDDKDCISIQMLFQAVIAHKPDAVLVTSGDRFSRSALQYQSIIDDLMAHNVKTLELEPGLLNISTSSLATLLSNSKMGGTL